MCGGKIVNVILNSNLALSGSTNNNAIYGIDFATILKPNKPYKMHWTYVGQANTITAASRLALVQINFTMEQYRAAGSGNGASTTMTIGCLRTMYVNGTINYLFADDNNNPPVYLKNRPIGQFTVQVVTNQAGGPLWTDNAATPVENNDYVLTLSFQEMDSSEDI